MLLNLCCRIGRRGNCKCSRVLRDGGKAHPSRVVVVRGGWGAGEGGGIQMPDASELSSELQHPGNVSFSLPNFKLENMS